MIEPNEELHALIERERAEAPPDAVIEQGWARLEAAMVAGLPPDPGLGLEGGAQTVTSAKLASTTSLKLVATVTAVVAGGVATWAITRDTNEPEPPSAVVQTMDPEPSPPAPLPEHPAIEPDDPSTPDEEELAAEPAGDVPPRPRAEPKPQDASDRLAAELALVDAARRALADEDADRALELARRHARLHRAGVLAEERNAIEAVALCKLGRPRARAVADRFLREHPRSTHIDRVHAACIGAPELPATDEESP